MAFGLRIAVAALVLVVNGSTVPGAALEETVTTAKSRALPESGRYVAQHSVSGHIEGVELADGVAAAKLEFEVRVKNEEGAGFLHDAVGSCIGVALYERESPSGSGLCTFEDEDGDVLFMRFAEDPYTSTGTAESIGGTGKYADIEVTQTHRTLAFEQAGGAGFEATGVRRGSWRPRE